MNFPLARRIQCGAYLLWTYCVLHNLRFDSVACDYYCDEYAAAENVHGTWCALGSFRCDVVSYDFLRKVFRGVNVPRVLWCFGQLGLRFCSFRLDCAKYAAAPIFSGPIVFWTACASILLLATTIATSTLRRDLCIGRGVLWAAFAAMLFPTTFCAKYSAASIFLLFYGVLDSLGFDFVPFDLIVTSTLRRQSSWCQSSLALLCFGQLAFRFCCWRLLLRRVRCGGTCTWDLVCFGQLPLRCCFLRLFAQSIPRRQFSTGLTVFWTAWPSILFLSM